MKCPIAVQRPSIVRSAALRKSALAALEKVCKPRHPRRAIMMRSAFRKLIEALEERHKQMAWPSQVIAIQFLEGDGREVEATVATDAVFNFACDGDFVCYRRKDEPLAVFRSRAQQRVPCQAAAEDAAKWVLDRLWSN